MIDYMKLANAIKFYSNRGYKYIEVPWTVDDRYMIITSPSPDKIVRLEENKTPLVASAEQSFLSLTKILKPGQYVACTPCFRNEDVIDDLHKDYFMKVELFKNDVVNEIELLKIIDIASSFFTTYADVEVIKTEIGYDITAKGIELGSYGIRQHETTGPWIYGTGCAEPRLSTVMAKRH